MQSYGARIRSELESMRSKYLLHKALPCFEHDFTSWEIDEFVSKITIGLINKLVVTNNNKFML